ncbi:IclR family transcriptional regulator [Sinosporangium siamense]|uniref:Glycerol operon regulatory protein n=1 Tax=Sinosporangium siamense TaxID=1367973 RepID=A0A919RJZ5_9ACTN|nr:IclR family transcriptional regulator [Sinosporangium siamense]GII95241.1 IclR family transcriptional regulator [Sinosporangium siamense]
MNAADDHTQGPEPRDFARRRGVRAVDRALDVLGAFSAAHPRFQLGELAHAAGLPKTSAHRIAVSLVERGFLRQEADGAYVLGTRLIELGSLVTATTALAHLTMGVAEELARTSGETVLVAEVDWRDRTLVITAKRGDSRSADSLSPVGRRSMLANGGLSRAILSGLPADEAEDLVHRFHLARRTPKSITDPAVLLREVDASRNRGHAIEIDEYIPGIAAVAVPVMIAGRPAGAVAVCGPTARMPRRRLDLLAVQIHQFLARSSAAGTPPAPMRALPEG